MTDQLETFRQEATMRMDAHDERLDAGDGKFDQINAKLDALIKNTDPIVKFLNDAQATGRMADRAQNIALWVLKWGVIWTAFITFCVAVKKFLFG